MRAIHLLVAAMCILAIGQSAQATPTDVCDEVYASSAGFEVCKLGMIEYPINEDGELDRSFHCHEWLREYGLLVCRRGALHFPINGNVAECGYQHFREENGQLVGVTGKIEKYLRRDGSTQGTCSNNNAYIWRQ